ncbi:hypothetical protein DCC85_09950 [Paenibacillus sp. CAA11]|uniref:DUF6508 domain-containing protein n=1 Tax=Paenibacillus sp. CAA11 TaxID=1532905 RepID=UPI000D379C4C|nr:DUF6508 domain-containing protein [Paenibacillus sp. CAA11]AWB44516.1 hypothetical protein DCC85_09950 [Paenibacillus sp. CAA11]
MENNTKSLGQADLLRLLEYRVYFNNPNHEFGRLDERGYAVEATGVQSFRELLYEMEFLISPFDWRTWLNGQEKLRDLDQPIEKVLQTFDIEDLRKLMTAYIRGDRYVEGAFLKACSTGKIGAILNRIAELLG